MALSLRPSLAQPCWRRLAWLAALPLVACGGGGQAQPAAPSTPAAPATPAAPVASTPAAAQALSLPPAYVLDWSDEFEVDGLPDPAKWAYDTGRNREGWYNNEKQYYASARPENSVVRGGQLLITARKEAMVTAPDWGGQAYSSARLLTLGKRDWTYGFVEVRAKLPCGAGTWPAIWMLNSAIVWPAGGELDILEQVGHDPSHVFSTVHTASGSGGQGSGNGVRLADVCSSFHTYQMLWTPQMVRFGIDGREHHRYVNAGTGTAQWPFDQPQFLILNLAIGGDLGGAVDDRIFPVTLAVDWVRVYQPKP